MASKGGWSRHFDEPIPLPRGRQLATLEDAGKYITKLPKAEHEAAEWQAAMEALIPGRDVGRPAGDSLLTISAEFHDAVMVLPPDKRCDRTF
jgi:hypothetical protein